MMESRYVAGYNSVADFDWSRIPFEIAVKQIDAYKNMALKRGNEFFAGVAQGAWDQLVQRELVA